MNDSKIKYQKIRIATELVNQKDYHAVIAKTLPNSIFSEIL